jgi:hypothetical protein
MARAIYTGIYHLDRKALDEPLTDSDVDPVTGIIFAATSATIIYSYLAVEAFVNYLLFQIWQISPKVHAKIAAIRRENPELGKNLFGYDRFYQKYGHCREFESLKSTDLRDLGERIKIICKTYNIPQVHEADPQLWQSFKDLLEKARHFLIHPFPDPSKFQDTMKTILWDTGTGEYAQIAQRIIAHIYRERGLKTPAWLEKNTLFTIKGFDYIHERECSTDEVNGSEHKADEVAEEH